VLVEDEDANQVGAYRLSLTCSNCPALAADHDGDGVANTADVCPATGDPAQTNTDAAPLDIPGATFDDVTRPNGDNIGDACDADDDNDGLLDGVESGCGVYAVPMNSSSALSADSDGDRSQDLYECMVGTNPGSAASKPDLAALGGADNDQLPDALDLFFGSFPNAIDSDQDGIADGVEVRGYYTSPFAQFTDFDGCQDDTEIASINGDDIVSAIDLNQVAQRFFVTTAPAFDLNKDGTISALDLSLQAQNFNLTPCGTT
jgi:hypothetical protein